MATGNHTISLAGGTELPQTRRFDQLWKWYYSPELNPQENLWDEIREKIFKNYALKSMSDVDAKLDEAAL